MTENEWSAQLKKIEREFDGLPPEPSPAAVRARSEAERRGQQRSALIGAMARLVLVLALGVALSMWPYTRDCGSGLFGYVGVEAVMLIGGLWVAISTWRSHLGKTHAFALILVLCSIVLIAAEVLPRAGYAKVDPRHPPTWWCP